jgi:uncharacterized protein YkwD
MHFQGNWVDLIIILVLIYFFLDGLRSGFFNQFFELVGFVISLCASLIFFPRVAPLFVKFFQIPESFANAISFFLVWFLIEAIYVFLVQKILVLGGKITMSKLSKWLGFLPGIVNGLVMLAFLLTLIVVLPVPSFLKKDLYASTLGSKILSETAQLEQPFQEIFGPAAKDLQKSLTFLTITPESQERVPLQIGTSTLRVDEQAEQKMFDLVNSERVKVSLKQLVWDARISDAALAHSCDMFERRYFSHISPEGKDVGDRLIEAKISFFVAGENLAYAPDVLRAHEGLMNSPGHRANILNPQFGKIGIGVIDGGIYGMMFTQNFTD